MSAFEKWSVWITSVLTGLTGVGYFWTKYLVESADAFAVVNHPLEPWFLKAHILVSPLLLFALGMILVRHVWKHVRLGVRWGRRSGLVTGAVLFPMVVTGYLIQTVTQQGWLRAIVITHLVTGFVYLLGLGIHQVAVLLLRPAAKNRRKKGENDEEGVDAGPEAPPAPRPGARPPRYGRSTSGDRSRAASR